MLADPPPAPPRSTPRKTPPSLSQPGHRWRDPRTGCSTAISQGLCVAASPGFSVADVHLLQVGQLRLRGKKGQSLPEPGWARTAAGAPGLRAGGPQGQHSGQLCPPQGKRATAQLCLLPATGPEADPEPISSSVERICVRSLAHRTVPGIK